MIVKVDPMLWEIIQRLAERRENPLKSMSETVEDDRTTA